MIKVSNDVIKKQTNFWNNCLFHPTDAVEDSWGKRILDQMAEDECIKTVRIYTMFEDIVYMDMNGNLSYDFRANDLRLEYLIEKGYDVLLAYAAMPDCIAQSTTLKTSVSFKKTRYKGKMFNTSPPKDYKVWEEICYEYTKHIVEKFGIERVSKWRMQCFNEADIPDFFMSHLPHGAMAERLEEYCKLYSGFAKAIGRVSNRLKIGGPALALYIDEFLEPWLNYVKDNNLKLDFISYHNYGCLGFYEASKIGSSALNVEHHFAKHKKVVEVVKKCGFGNLPIVIDEWGAVGGGFKNKSVVPELVFRETEVFPAYFAKLLHKYIYSDFIVDNLMICLSGQHEMEEEFTGFRGFFTLNNIAKPIYNGFVMAAKLKENILKSDWDNENIFVTSTKDDKGNYAVLLTYSLDDYAESLPEITEVLKFGENISQKRVSVYCIDKTHTNPFRLWERNGSKEITQEDLSSLRKEGKLKPCKVISGAEPLELTFTPNSTYLIIVE